MSTERTYRALLVGNSVFPEDGALGDLHGPRNDVAAMASALSHVEWGLHDPTNVQSLVDEAKAVVEGAMEDFFSSASPQDQLLFFYSGHGIHEVYERLFLATIDTRSTR